MGQSSAPMFPSPGPIGQSTAQNIVSPVQPLAKAPKQQFIRPQTEFPGVTQAANGSSADPQAPNASPNSGGGGNAYDDQFAMRARQFYGY